MCSPSRMPVCTGRNFAVMPAAPLPAVACRVRRGAPCAAGAALPGRAAAAARDEHAGLAVELDQRVARNGQRVGLRVDRQLHARIHARLQAVAAVRDFDLHFRGARRRIEDRRDAADAAGELLARERVDFDRRAACRPARASRPSRPGSRPSARCGCRRPSDRRVRADEGARIEKPLADEAVDRRGDDRVREGDLQLVEPRLRLLELRLREIELRHAPPGGGPRCRRRSAAAAAAGRAGSSTGRGWSWRA